MEGGRHTLLMTRQFLWGALCFLVVMQYGAAWPASAESSKAEKVRFAHVDSYHAGYKGSEMAFKGFSEGLMKYGFLDGPEQIQALIQHDTVESSTAIVKRWWMDSKRKNTKPEMMESTVRITKELQAFQPTVLFVSDDAATNYLGNQLLDTPTPVVFFGVKNTPVKYGLVDSLERPGHNLTGTYAGGYYKESLELLKALVPSAKTFAIISDDGDTGRSHVKAVEDLVRQGVLPLQWVETASIKHFQAWKQKILELQGRVDAFYVAAINSLEDDDGRDVPREEAIEWYLTHVKIPEASHAKSYVEQGLLCAADFNRYDQGFEAVTIANDVLTKGMSPATYPPIKVKRGPQVVNKERAQMLGLMLTPAMGIEEYVDNASVLHESSSGAMHPADKN